MVVMTSLARFRSTATFLTIWALGACAASPKAEVPRAAPGSPVPASPAASLAAEPEPQTLAEAEAQLEKARVELEQLALSPAPRSASGTAAPAPAPPPPAASESTDRAEGAAEATAKAGAPCQSACRAYSSLARASDAVCRLEAEGGPRCERARRIRDDASRRVASCACVQ